MKIEDWNSKSERCDVMISSRLASFFCAISPPGQTTVSRFTFSSFTVATFLVHKLRM